MPVLVGGLAAIVALAAGIMGNVDPVTTVIRSSLAFLLVWFAAKMWQAILSTQAIRFEERVGTEEEGVPIDAAE